MKHTFVQFVTLLFSYMSIIWFVALLLSYTATAQSYDPWKDATWYKLRGRFIYEYLESANKPCKDSANTWWGNNRIFDIPRPIVDSISQGELDSMRRIKNARWAVNDYYLDESPPGMLVAGTIRSITIMTDCPPTVRGPFFIIETKDYIRKKKKKGLPRRVFRIKWP